MELRGAQRADYKAIRGLLKAGVQEGSLQPRKKKEVKKNLAGFVVAEDAGEIVGMASVVVYDRRLAEVRSLYVKPEHRGNGIARDLVTRVQERTVSELPSSTLIAITQTPRVFEQDGFSSQQGERHVVFKNI